MINLPDPDDAARMAAFVDSRAGWSVFWDKRHGVWRASEDDLSSDLYEEDTDARNVIGYIAAHT